MSPSTTLQRLRRRVFKIQIIAVAGCRARHPASATSDISAPSNSGGAVRARPPLAAERLTSEPAAAWMTREAPLSEHIDNRPVRAIRAWQGCKTSKQARRRAPPDRQQMRGQPFGSDL